MLKEELKEAEILYVKLNEALRIFERMEFKENEVDFRYKAIRGMLTIASSDVYEMKKCWENEENENS